MHEGHRDRMRERFLSEGLEGFAPHNVLELLLFYTIPRKDTNELAHRLLQAFGTIDGVFDAPYHALLEIDGVGETTASLLKLVPDLSRRYLSESSRERMLLNSPDKVGAFFVSRFVGLVRERVYLLGLDGKSMVQYCCVVADGSLFSAEVSRRKLAEVICRYNSANVILAHNHPHGVAAPSKSDIEFTEDLSFFLHEMQVFFHDHIIVSGEEYLSMRENQKWACYFD